MKTISTTAILALMTASIGLGAVAPALAQDATTASRRPNLTNSSGQQEIAEVLAVRTPIYRACATLEVDTEGKTPAEIADEIVATLGLT